MYILNHTTKQNTSIIFKKRHKKWMNKTDRHFWINFIQNQTQQTIWQVIYF